MPRGVRQRATSFILRGCDRYFARGEGNFGETRLRGLRGAQMQGIEERSIKEKRRNNFFNIVQLAGISRMSSKIIGRDAMPHLHGSQFRHRLVSVRARGRVFGLRQTVRTLSPLSS